jgi:hypothetical protein
MTVISAGITATLSRNTTLNSCPVPDLLADLGDASGHPVATNLTEAFCWKDQPIPFSNDPYDSGFDTYINHAHLSHVLGPRGFPVPHAANGSLPTGRVVLTEIDSSREETFWGAHRDDLKMTLVTSQCSAYLWVSLLLFAPINF